MIQSRELLQAIKAAKAAGKIIKANYQKGQVLSFKGSNERVTNVDLLAEKAILNILKKAFPSHSFYSEEAGKERKVSDYLWAIDPLDGTTNYTIMNPFFNTSIGLAYRGEPVLGVVYNPIQDELFFAEKGKGAFLNHTRIHVSTRAELSRAVIGACYGAKNQEAVQRAVRLYAKLKLQATRMTRQFGSAALELCYVAAGRIEAFEMSDLNAYDVAAGAIIAKEAGATVTDFSGKLFTLKARDILASNGIVHQELLKILDSGGSDHYDTS